MPKKTTKFDSTGDKVLSSIVTQHPIVQMIRDWRSYSKLKGTYTDVLPTQVGSDGRIHSTFRITRTATGRLSSANPNLMNQPTRSDDGKLVRNCYIAQDGCSFVSGDYCVTGDTEVVTLNGVKPIKDIKRGEFVLSSWAGESVEFKEVTDTVCLIDKQPIVALELEDGSIVRCTAPHKWMTYEGTLVKTEDLKPGDRLAHVQSGISGRYPTWWMRSATNYVYKHRLADRLVNGESAPDFEVDHINGDITDWRAQNLRRLPTKENRAQGGARYWREVREGRSDDVRLAALRTGLATRRSYDGEGNPNFGKYKGEICVCATCGESFYRPYSHISETNFCCADCYHGYRRTGNHRVKCVTPLKHAETVYCLAVADNHTFVLANGLISSNSQIEMRVLADQTGDPELIRIFSEGLDIHAQTASRIFHLPVDQLDDMKHRYPAKRVGFGIVYGITEDGLLEQLIMVGLNDWDRESCRKLIESWFGVYSHVGPYMEELARHARQHGYVRDMWGRIRYVATIHAADDRLKAEALRQAGNMPIQSGAQGIIKIAMGRLVPLYREYLSKGAIVRPLIQIHDDLVFEVQNDLIDEWVAVQKSVMEGAAILKVPVKVDFKSGPIWGSMEKYKLK